jgi:F0F1-type ATP synthase membrane subunit b/b'
MSSRTFWQAVALILIGALAYWGVAQILNWQAERAYQERLKERESSSASPAAAPAMTEAQYEAEMARLQNEANAVVANALADTASHRDDGHH